MKALFFVCSTLHIVKWHWKWVAYGKQHRWMRGRIKIIISWLHWCHFYCFFSLSVCVCLSVTSEHLSTIKSLCGMVFGDFQCSSHVCSVCCRTLSVRNAFLKNKFAKYHHFLSLSILFLSIEDETIPPPFVAYILSTIFSDSFKKF